MTESFEPPERREAMDEWLELPIDPGFRPRRSDMDLTTTLTLNEAVAHYRSDSLLTSAERLAAKVDVEFVLQD